MKTDVVEAAGRLSEKYGVMSNVYRMMMTAYLQKKGQASWSELKQFLEEYFGSVNPNTMHFHLKALVEAKILERKGSEDKMSYTIGTIPEYISKGISDEILTKLKKKAE
jgi:hypothetical protein